MLAEIFPLVKKCKEENPETGFESLRCGAKNGERGDWGETSSAGLPGSDGKLCRERLIIQICSLRASLY